MIPEIAAFLQSLVWEVNSEKSALTLSQSFKYLGLHFRSDLKIVHPADDLLDRLHQDLNVFTRKILVISRELQSFVGLINFLAPIVDLGRLHMRPIQLWLASRWDHTLLSIDLPLTVNPDLLEAIKVWLGTEWILQGVPLLSLQLDYYLFTDSSMQGWGASLSGKDIKDVWRGSHRSLTSITWKGWQSS